MYRELYEALSVAPSTKDLALELLREGLRRLAKICRDLEVAEIQVEEILEYVKRVERIDEDTVNEVLRIVENTLNQLALLSYTLYVASRKHELRACAEAFHAYILSLHSKLPDREGLALLLAGTLTLLKPHQTAEQVEVGEAYTLWGLLKLDAVKMPRGAWRTLEERDVRRASRYLQALAFKHLGLRALQLLASMYSIDLPRTVDELREEERALHAEEE